MQSADIRRTYLEFFEQRGHTVVPSAPLVARGDPSLLFVNAGMVPFKDVFLGKEQRGYTRATSCQRCLRVSGKHNDLEEVGPSSQHHTFFEMLGNFSFGDYFKPEAIEFAWELLTKVFDMPPDRLHPTVFEEDAESAQLWSKVTGWPESRIVRLGADENFWSMGDTGPCGPNSEILYDRSGKCLRDGSDCFLTCDCDRWWEVWNLVFMQFDRAADGSMAPLAKPGVDTGMGLERVTTVLQDVETNYENDLFVPIITSLRALTGESDIARERRPAYRAVADHARSLTFLIADGVVPSNEGRGYVLRRILRRASYQGRTIGLHEPFLAGICERVIDQMASVYPEVREHAARIVELVSDEEQRFLTTLDSGLARLEDAISAAQGTTTLPGDEAFKLYDTYGFPIDLTRNVLEARGWSVDESGFQRALEEQRRRAREALEAQRGRDEPLIAATKGLPATRFVGYETLDADAALLALVKDAQATSGAIEGDEVEVVLDVSPFYAEGGGQVGDRGRIVGADGAAEIDAVRRLESGVFVHSGRVAVGRLAASEPVRAEVDAAARSATKRNHTATHLLHKALRVVLGPQAKQAGSLVAPDRLRFDFLHNKPLADGELREVERLVREQILLDKPVTTDVMPVQQALDSGADAMFDEKYGAEARVVTVNGDGAFSRELCGGTHCRETGEIGAFFIIEQRSVGAGVRRVEAVTGYNAFEYMDARRGVLDQLSREYNVPAPELPERLRALQERAKDAPAAAVAVDLPDPDELLARADKRNGALVVVEPLDGADATVLRDFGDRLRQQAKSAAVVLGSVFDGKPNVVIMLTADLVKDGLHAGRLAKEIGAAMGAGGGGRPDAATAGGRDPSRLNDALAKAKELLAG